MPEPRACRVAARRRCSDPAADAAALERMVLGARRADHAAWNGLVERFDGLVRSIAARHGLSQQDVEDVAQATWLRLLEHIDSIREPLAIPGWLSTTARRESLQVLSRASRELPSEVERMRTEAVAPVDEGRLVEAERRVALRGGLARLPRHQRAVLASLLSEPAQDYRQISGSLGIAVGSIGPTRARALDSLRRDSSLAALR